jgi:hypothetical protein
MKVRDVLRTSSFKVMVGGFLLAVIGIAFAASGMISIAQWLTWSGFFVVVIGIIMHFKVVLSELRKNLHSK